MVGLADGATLVLYVLSHSLKSLRSVPYNPETDGEKHSM